MHRSVSGGERATKGQVELREGRVVAFDELEDEVTGRPDDPIAADVEEAYRESDLPPVRARERAERAQDNADRSGQGEEGPREDERGVGAIDDRDGG